MEHYLGEVKSPLLHLILPVQQVVFDIDIGHLATSAMGRFEPSGTRCGPYRLGTLLGRGGMGTVHLAERIDGEITQQVAVKLLRPGIDGPTLRHRFLAERRILATLSHPNIARLLDAGHREDGQPYLVMEYIEGRTIDAYTAALGTRQTLNLFLKVCAAVSYLHRNLVVIGILSPRIFLSRRKVSQNCWISGSRSFRPDLGSRARRQLRCLHRTTQAPSRWPAVQ